MLKDKNGVVFDVSEEYESVLTDFMSNNEK